MNAIAKFEKVSKEQFKKDMKDQFHQQFTDDEIDKIREFLEIPRRSTVESAGYDLFAPFDFTLEPGQMITIPTGLKCHMDFGWFMMIVPRSGLGFKYGMELMNTLAIIDSDYVFAKNDGHILLKFENKSNAKLTINIKQGVGMAQAIFLPFGFTKDDQTEQSRTGGFGSTGM